MLLVAPKVFDAVPETIVVLVPVRLKVAPSETLKFFVFNAIANPPLLKIPLCTLKSPVTLLKVIAALKVAPLECELLTVKLL